MRVCVSTLQQTFNAACVFPYAKNWSVCVQMPAFYVKVFETVTVITLELSVDVCVSCV